VHRNALPLPYIFAADSAHFTRLLPTEHFKFQQVDVFASSPLRGNPLAVVIGADQLTDLQMATFANWTNVSETAILLAPRVRGADYRVRIFTPHRELPFAGHPTLGSCHVWLTSGGLPKGNEVMQECEIGLVRIRRDAGRFSFAAPDLIRSGPIETEILARVVEGLQLPPHALISSNWVDNGPGWMALWLRTRDDVLAVRPNYAAFSGLRIGVVAAWNRKEDGSDAQFEVRAFMAEGYEDPVTGSLNAGLAQWLISTGLLLQTMSSARVPLRGAWGASM
jgi:PhzF family phenazine biosynthesis protein